MRWGVTRKAMARPARNRKGTFVDQVDVTGAGRYGNNRNSTRSLVEINQKDSNNATTTTKAERSHPRVLHTPQSSSEKLLCLVCMLVFVALSHG
jgi:hypothetical protein